MINGVPLRMFLSGLPGERNVDKCDDAIDRICVEHLCVALSPQTSANIGDQSEAMEKDVAKLCIGFDGQEDDEEGDDGQGERTFHEIPILSESAGVQGGTNPQVLFAYMLIACMFSQRKLIFSTRGSTGFKMGCKLLVDAIRNKGTTMVIKLPFAAMFLDE